MAGVSIAVFFEMPDSRTLRVLLWLTSRISFRAKIMIFPGDAANEPVCAMILPAHTGLAFPDNALPLRPDFDGNRVANIHSPFGQWIKMDYALKERQMIWQRR
jgi:hypothetical protein